MTKEQFLKPYLLLVFQPWGRRYDLGTPEGQTQSEFYYNQLHWAHPDAWQRVAQQHAQGEQWPTLTALKQAVQHINADYVRALPKPSGGYITRDEFGQDLYECIRCYAQRELCEQQQRDGWQRIHADLGTRIESLMPKLDAQDAAMLYRRYEKKAAASF